MCVNESLTNKLVGCSAIFLKRELLYLDRVSKPDVQISAFIQILGESRIVFFFKEVF
jgi:hypothetical protein